MSAEEIKICVFKMKPDKVPGPDGYTASFFQNMWHVVGHDVIAAVQSFFADGRILKQFNSTSLTLVPKILNPSKLSDYRPISCCNFIYKCISGVIAQRMKKVLPDIINPAQSAFVPGRNIADNILLAQELLRNYHRTATKPRCNVKVDILKAYDTMN